ncbi:unnamed protein product, partial [Penicillium discolor]
MTRRAVEVRVRDPGGVQTRGRHVEEGRELAEHERAVPLRLQLDDPLQELVELTGAEARVGR